MRIREFKYTKANEPASDRRVLALHETDDFIEGIDLSHVTPAEKDLLEKLAAEMGVAIEAVKTKAYRRFKKSQIV